MILSDQSAFFSPVAWNQDALVTTIPHTWRCERENSNLKLMKSRDWDTMGDEEKWKLTSGLGRKTHGYKPEQELSPKMNVTYTKQKYCVNYGKLSTSSVSFEAPNYSLMVMTPGVNRESDDLRVRSRQWMWKRYKFYYGKRKEKSFEFDRH